MTMSLDEWRHAISRSFAPLIIHGNDETYFASLRQVEVGDVHLFEMQTGPHRVERAPSLIGPDSPHYCKLSLQLEGESLVMQDGREALMHPGELVLYVTHRPYELSYDAPQRTLVVQFPQNYVNLSDAQLAEVTARPISRDVGLGRVAVALFEQLADNLDVLHGPHAVSLVRSALDMVVAALTATAAPTEGESLLYRQAAAYIEDHLDDVELSPSTIASALYVSVRQLHSRFSEQGHTVAHYVRGRRLAVLRQFLGDPQLAPETVQALGARVGLPDASYVSKTFKAEHGETPSAYRKRILGLS